MASLSLYNFASCLNCLDYLPERDGCKKQRIKARPNHITSNSTKAARSIDRLDINFAIAFL
jgi:hypothetical protein